MKLFQQVKLVIFRVRLKFIAFNQYSFLQSRTRNSDSCILPWGIFVQINAELAR